jgi:hypothetical protein
MINFKELKITPDNKYLRIEVAVNEADAYKNILITGIKIDNQDTYNVTGPSENLVYESTNGVGLKGIALNIPNEDIKGGLSNNMFFVYIETTGSINPDYNIPESLLSEKNVGVVINLYPIYSKAMNYTKELCDCPCCNIPKGFIDFILKVKALDLSVATGNYIQAIEYWNKLFKPRHELDI